MILNPDKAEIEALAHLEHNAHFKTIMGWLARSLEQTQYQCMIEHDEIEARRLQGAGIDIYEIIGYAKNARELINR